MSDTYPALTEIKPLPLVAERGAERLRAIDLVVVNDGGQTVCEPIVRIDDAVKRLPPIDLPPGESRSRITVPEPVAPARLCCSLEGASEQTVHLEPAWEFTVYLVQSAHFDPGYTDLPSRVMNRYIDHFRDIVRFCDETDDWPDELRFRYQVECAWSLLHTLEHGPSDLSGRIIERIREGRIGINALYANMITELCSSEELVRLLYPAFKLKHEYRIPICTAEHNDIPGVAWGLVSVLAGAGVRWLFPGLPRWYFGNEELVRTFWDETAMRPRGVSTVFRWEGPDGNHVMVLDHDDGAGGIRDRSFLELYDALAVAQTKGYPYSCIRSFANGAFTDNAPPTMDWARSVKAHNEMWTWPRIRLATNSEFVAALETELGDEVATVRGDFPGTDYPIGATCEASTTGLNRRTHERLSAAERWAAIVAATTSVPYPQTLLRKAWIDVLRYDEHVFGLGYTGGTGHDAARAEKRLYAHRAAATADDVAIKMVHRLADTIHRSEAGYYLVVFNSLPHSRTDTVRVPCQSVEPASSAIGLGDYTTPGLVPGVPWGAPVLWRHMVNPPIEFFLRGFAVVDMETGETQAHQLHCLQSASDPSLHAADRYSRSLGRWPTDSVSIEFTAQDVPPLGYRTYKLVPNEVAKTATATRVHASVDNLESPFYRVSIDPDEGRIVSIIDKETGHELIDREAAYSFHQLIGRSFVDGSITCAGRSTVRVVRTGPVAVSVIFEGDGPGCPQRTQEIQLYQDAKRIDFSTRLLKDPDPSLELYLSFPFAVEQPQFRYETALGVVETIRDQLPGTSTDAYSVQRFVDICNDSRGVTWSSLDAPVVLFGQLWPLYVSPAHHNRRPPGFIHDALTTPDQFRQGHLYALLATNNYGTNFASSQSGDMLFRFSIMSRSGGWNPVPAYQHALAVTTPLDTVTLECEGGGSAPSHGSFAEVTPATVELMALKWAEDGDGLIVRVREAAGRPAESVITLPFVEIESVTRCNLVEEDEGGLSHKANTITVALTPCEVATFRVRMASGVRRWPEQPW